jgi:hypothetical protein
LVLAFFFGRKLIALGERLTERHITFLDRTTEVQQQQSTTLVEIKSLHVQQAESLDRLAKGQEDISRRIKV